MPDGLDLFGWSMPFLAEKITGMLYACLKQCSPSELKDMALDDDGVEILKAETTTQNEKMKRKLVLRNKISTVGKMSRMLSFMRENQEELLKLKGMSQDGKLPRGALLE